jgi:hypothetical protein
MFYEVSGKFYPTLFEAQKADLMEIIPMQWPDGTASGGLLASWLLENAEAVAVILTTTPKSRRQKPRKDKGKPRKDKGKPRKDKGKPRKDKAQEVAP